METPVPYKVFAFDEDGCPTFIAATSEQAARDEYNTLFADPCDCRELPDEALDRMKVALTDENDVLTGEFVTVRAYLAEASVGESGDAFYLCGEE